MGRQGQGREQGTIRRLDAVRKFGFIRSDGGTDFFFHMSGVEQTAKQFNDLREGDTVQFTPAQGEKGPRAEDVRAI